MTKGFATWRASSDTPTVVLPIVRLKQLIGKSDSHTPTPTPTLLLSHSSLTPYCTPYITTLYAGILLYLMPPSSMDEVDIQSPVGSGPCHRVNEFTWLRDNIAH